MDIKIIGSGSCIPDKVLANIDFENHHFFDENGKPYAGQTNAIIKKLSTITGIRERRYASDVQVTSDLATVAAKLAIQNAGIPPESLDYILVAHNFGDIPHGKTQSDLIPSLASRVKNKLSIKNPDCVAFDIIAGCPGWIQGVIQSTALLKAGMARRCLVIGAECLSRVSDPYDRDSMIYADGAGAVILESGDEESGHSLLDYVNQSFTDAESGYLFFGKGHNIQDGHETQYLKMHGRKIYEFALDRVPTAIKTCLEEANIGIEQVTKLLIHQANEKMDEAILRRLYKLYDATPPEDVMPMTIHTCGNSSVATVPTLYDLLVSGRLEGHDIQKGDIIVFASIGAGMNINALVHRF